MVLKEENQVREPAIQEIACVATVFKRVCGERWNVSQRTCPETLDFFFFVSDKILTPISNYLIQCRFN